MNTSAHIPVLLDQVVGAMERFDPEEYLSDFTFYTDGDRRFCFIRDEVFGPNRFRDVMDRMIADCGHSLDDLAKGLWMDDATLLKIHHAGHILGMHSHTHPTRLHLMDASQQADEYIANHKHLKQITGQPPCSMSHPCGSYNQDTLDVLRDLGVKLGFDSRMRDDRRHEFDYPRLDHALIRTGA